MLMTAPCFAHGHDGRRREALAAAATIAFATILALGAGPAAARTADTLHCGDTVTHSVRLTADIRDCPGTGLSVGADGITIDLAGHTIDGVAPTAADCGRLPFDHTGIDDRGGFDRITVRDGTIREFDDGVGGGFGHSRMTNLRLRANPGGIDIGSGDVNDDLDANTVDANVVDDDGAACGLRHGIGLTGSHDSVIARNRITGVAADELSSAITLVTGGRNRVAQQHRR